MESLNSPLPHPLKNLLLESLSVWQTSLPSNRYTDHLALSIFKKYVPERKRNEQLFKNALTTFLETECRMGKFNDSRIFRTSGLSSSVDAAVFLCASRKIRSILGSFSINEMIDQGQFGPGSTYGCRGSDVSLATKFTRTDVTDEFLPLARGLLAEYPHWSGALAGTDFPVCPMLTPVPGGRYLTVPKDRSTDRSIIAEPTINSWFQRGLGKMIRRRLKRFSVDLDDQTVNQRLAAFGSLHDDLATVDLSSASDLISTELVRDLIPEDWFFWLNVTRSQKIEVEGSVVRLKKFSSMGNGFTFDLQSLIFYALSYAVTVLEGYNPFWVNVFGDDIIIPSGVKDRFLAVFASVGFIVNTSKSFFSGPFRESCGHDYWLGENIRGLYVRELFTFADIVKLHNRIFEWSVRARINCMDIIRFLRDIVSDLVDLIPQGYGDGGLASSFDDAVPTPAAFGFEGHIVYMAVPIVRKYSRNDRFAMVARLSQRSDFAGNFFPLREEIAGYRTRRTLVLF